MSYTAYEARTGEVLERVQALCRNLTTQGKFTDSSPVPLSDVEQWITDQYWRLTGELLAYGFGTAVTTDPARSVLSQIQALGAAMSVQLAGRTGITEPDQKYLSLQGQWQGLLTDWVRKGGLQELGASRTQPSRQQAELTGRSVSRKTTAYADTDATAARFPTGFGKSTKVAARSGVHTSTDTTE